MCTIRTAVAALPKRQGGGGATYGSTAPCSIPCTIICNKAFLSSSRPAAQSTAATPRLFKFTTDFGIVDGTASVSKTRPPRIGTIVCTQPARQLTTPRYTQKAGIVAAADEQKKARPGCERERQRKRQREREREWKWERERERERERGPASPFVPLSPRRSVPGSPVQSKTVRRSSSVLEGPGWSPLAAAAAAATTRIYTSRRSKYQDNTTEI